MDELAEKLLAASAEGCCMDDSWRGHACSYHLGFTDGMDALILMLRPKP